MKRKIISLITAILLSLNLFTIMPPNAFAASGDSRTYEKDGYTVTYKIGSEWENNRTVEVNIKNTGKESILNWALKYDVGGEMSNLWNSKLYDKGEDYVIIKNNGYNYEIEPEQTVSCGYMVTSKETVIPEDIELCSRRIDVSKGYNVDFNIINDWNTGFQAEVTIENTSTESIEAWTLLFDGNFTINNVWNAKLLSSDNGKYEVANQLWTTPIKAGESASFGFTADKSATENAKAENFQLTAVVIGESVLENEPDNPDNSDDIDYELDTDADGLPDYYEEIIGTYKNNVDTDGDGLSDGYEVLYLGTDPLKADSDDNGINDGDEDFDNDGLTNAEECELGTDPNNDDTDGDGLSDSAELNTHGTDPLKYDTDGDGVSDGDEITLGLNPNSFATNGTPDNERTFTQTVSADSDVLSAINDDKDTPFNVSLEMKVAGVAENNVYACKSGYSNAIKSSAVIGAAPEFAYTDELAIEEVTVKFELNNSIINNTLGTYTEASGEFQGIKRFNIFMFFEDINMLLPIETLYNEENNIVYTTTDKMGTYCLMDMELWLDLLGVPVDVSSNSENEKVSTLSDFSIDNDVRMLYNMKEVSVNSSKSKYKDGFEVTFIIDEENYREAKLDAIKEKICLTVAEIWNRSPNVAIKIYGMNNESGGYYDSYGEVYKDASVSISDVSDGKYEKLNCILANISQKKSGSAPVLSKVIDNIYKEHGSKGNEEYVFVFFDATKTNYQNDEKVWGSIQGIVNNGKLINISVVSNISDDVSTNTYAGSLFFKTNGINLNENLTNKKFKERAIAHIYNEENVYEAITAIGYERILLDEPITEKYRDAAMNKITDYQGMADTDGDGLYDFQEIDFDVELDGEKLIQFDSNGNIKDLPLAEVCHKLYEDSKDEKNLTYVENGWEIFEESVYSYYMNEINILPIKSDPTRIDSDEDGIVDCTKYLNSYEFNVEGIGRNLYHITEFDDPNPLKYDYLWQWPLIDTYGTKVAKIKSGFYEKRKNKDENGNFYTNYHSAIDISTDSNVGYTVVAAYDGILKSVRTMNGGGCSITLIHNINGKQFTSSYLHMAYYDYYYYEKLGKDYDNSHHSFKNYINNILKKNEEEQTFDDLFDEPDISSLGIFVKAGTPIGVAAGTLDKYNREEFGIHLDFRVRDENDNYINPITFNKYLDSSKRNLKRCTTSILINVPKKLENACAHDDVHASDYKNNTWCDCKDELEGGEAFDIRKLYKIDYKISTPNKKDQGV